MGKTAEEREASGVAQLTPEELRLQKALKSLQLSNQAVWDRENARPQVLVWGSDLAQPSTRPKLICGLFS